MRRRLAGQQGRRARVPLARCRRTVFVVAAALSFCALQSLPNADRGAAAAGAPSGCPSGRVRISVANRHRGAATTVVVTGTLLTPTCAADPALATSYARTLVIPSACSTSCTCGAGQTCRCAKGVAHCVYTASNLSPGEWLHQIEVTATGQKQSRRALTMGDPGSAASVRWIAYASTLTVRSDLDDGSPGTLRQAIATASATSARPPTLIQFDRGRVADGPITIRLTDPRQLRVSKETVIDGTDSAGNPSPLAAFASRSYPTVIELDPTDAAAAHAATLRFNSTGSGVRGLYLRRVLGADRLLPGRDQDLVAFGAGARRR